MPTPNKYSYLCNKFQTMQKILFILFGSMLLFTCNKAPVIEDFQLPVIQHKYYPLAVGDWAVYEVDSIIFSPGLTGIDKDTSFRLIKEEVIDTFRNLTGHLVYRIERQSKPRNATNWQDTKVFTKRIQNNKALHTEDNIQYTKFIFPLEVFNSWDGNNAFSPDTKIPVGNESMSIFRVNWDYTIKNTNDTLRFQGEQFKDLLFVEEINHYSVTESRYSTAYYKKNRGLVYQEQRMYDRISGNNILPLSHKTAEIGFILKKRLVDWKQ